MKLSEQEKALIRMIRDLQKAMKDWNLAQILSFIATTFESMQKFDK